MSTTGEQSLSIGLFGGSFDPPHIAHVLVAGWALAEGEIDRLWVIPAGGHPFGKRSAPFADRFEMCRRAFACFGERVAVLDVERSPETHYSIDTLRGLARLHPTCRWRWVMGSDQLEQTEAWKTFDELAQLAPPLIIPRQGYPAPPSTATLQKDPPRAQDFALPDLSSSFLRERLAAGAFDEVLGLAPASVLDLIRHRGLYAVSTS